MSQIVLVHGRNANAASWNDTARLLERKGHTVRSVTLTDHDRRLPILKIAALIALGQTSKAASLMEHPTSTATMDNYIDAVMAALPKDGSKATLIGHSMGGAVISHVADRVANHPDSVIAQSIDRLIYVAAMLPDEDETIMQIEREIAAVGTSPLGFVLEFEEIGADAFTALVQQPKGPFAAPFPRTTAYETIPRFYVRCEDDQVIPVEVQDAMLGRVSVKDIALFPGGHLPQYQVQDKLIETIEDFLAQ